MDEEFVEWFAVRYGVMPSDRDLYQCYGLWKWVRSHERARFSPNRHIVRNRYLMRMYNEKAESSVL
jgi:hypothetical protein